jgi:hypothetical protein
MAIDYQYKIRFVETLPNNGVNEIRRIAFRVTAVDDTDSVEVSWTSECEIGASDTPVEYNTLLKSDLVTLINDTVGKQQIKQKLKVAFDEARAPQPSKHSFPWV